MRFEDRLSAEALHRLPVDAQNRGPLVDHRQEQR